MAPRRCDRNTCGLPQRGQNRLESGFIPYTTSPIAFSSTESSFFLQHG